MAACAHIRSPTLDRAAFLNGGVEYIIIALSIIYGIEIINVIISSCHIVLSLLLLLIIDVIIIYGRMEVARWPSSQRPAGWESRRGFEVSHVYISLDGC